MNLEWKIQCMETNTFVAESQDSNVAPGGPSALKSSSSTKTTATEESSFTSANQYHAFDVVGSKILEQGKTN